MTTENGIEPCSLTMDEERACPRAAVVAVLDRRGDLEWGCEDHALRALRGIEGARIGGVRDWAACRRLIRRGWQNSARVGGVGL